MVLEYYMMRIIYTVFKRTLCDLQFCCLSFAFLYPSIAKALLGYPAVVSSGDVLESRLLKIQQPRAPVHCP
jgi:hypothetical protein